MKESENGIRLVYLRYDQLTQNIKTITERTLYFKTAADALNFYKGLSGVWNGEYYEELL